MKNAMFELKDALNSKCEKHPLIKVRRSDLETLVSGLFHSAGEWSNQSALGYVIASAEWAGFSSDEIDTLVMEIKRRFDEVTLEEAAEHYRISEY